MEISLPDNFNRYTMYPFISDIIFEDNKPKYEDITLNFSRLNFIKPSGLTILHNIIQWLIKQGVEVRFNIPKNFVISNQQDAIKYLDDSGFFEYYLKKKVFDDSKMRSTTIPLKNVTIEEYYSWLEDTFILWLANSLKSMNTLGFSGIKASIGEIFNNIKDHSFENIGCAFAQHYPNYNKIEIAISDFGVGIPYQIRKKFGCKDDSEALELAIKEGYTTKSIPTNRGSGLETLVKFVLNVEGDIYIHSNKGKLESFVNENNKNVRTDNAAGFYPGTLILIKLPTNRIYEEPDEEDFSW